MRRLTFHAFLFVLLAASASVHAETKFNAAARAKAIASVVEKETAIVIHIDLSRVSPQPTFELLRNMRLSAPLEMWRRQVSGLLREGAKDVYLIVPPASIFTDNAKVLLAVPVSSGSQEKALRQALQLRTDECRMVGNVLVIGMDGQREFQPADRPELTAAFEAAGDTSAQVILIPPADTRRVADELLPQLPRSFGGGPSSILTRGICWAAAGIDGSPHKTFRLVIQSEDAKAAEALRGKAVELLRLAGQQTEVRKHVPEFEAVAAFLTPKVEGSRLIVSSNENVATFEKAAAAVMRPWLEAESRMASVNNLKQIALAMHNYYQANSHLPLPASHDSNGKPLLSWRVHILPYLDQSSLFKQFHLDEPWDSPHNRTLIDKMPDVYRLPISKAEIGHTNYLLPVGNGAVFSEKRPTEFKDIKDGTSNTIMIVEGDDQHAAIWTKPADWPFDPKEPTKGLGRSFEGGFNAAICDGSVRTFRSPLEANRFRALFTRAGGEWVKE